jgi:hypothetical protein
MLPLTLFIFQETGIKGLEPCHFFLVKSIYEGDITFAVSCVIFLLINQLFYCNFFATAYLREGDGRRACDPNSQFCKSFFNPLPNLHSILQTLQFLNQIRIVKVKNGLLHQFA